MVIAYDDSDGWYDHVMPPIVNQSSSTADVLTTNDDHLLRSYHRDAVLRQWRHRASRQSTEHGTSSGPMRLRNSPATIGDFAVVERKLRGSHADGSNFRLRFIEDNWLVGERIGEGSTTTSPTQSFKCLISHNCRSAETIKSCSSIPATGLRTNQ